MTRQIVDRGDLRSYRTEIPNIVDDMDLSLTAFRLYIHLKRVAGDTGASWEGVRRLADACRMSVGAVRSAKAELEAAGLITVEHGVGEQADTITINDIWLENMLRYSGRNTRQAQPPTSAEEAETEPETLPETPAAARLVTHPRASGDTPPRAKRHTPARLVTHPRASGDTQERTNEERTNEEGRESVSAPVAAEAAAPAAPPALPPPPKKVVQSRSPHMPGGLQLPKGYVPAGSAQNAVQVYYERFRYDAPDARLSAPQEDDLVRICTDLGRLREVVTAYSRTNYRPGNVQLILDWYASGVPARMQGATHGPTTHNGTAQRGGAAGGGQAKPAWANYQPQPSLDAVSDADFWASR